MFMRLAVPILLFFAPRFLPHILRFARLVWRLSFDKRVPPVLRLLLPLAIFYIVLPYDFFKDTLTIPTFGMARLDDLLVLALALLLLVKLSPKAVLDEHNGAAPPSDRAKGKDKVVDGSGRVIDDE